MIGKSPIDIGKSQAAIFLVQARYEHDNNIRIGCTNERIYKRLLEVIPEANLVKLWEKSSEPELEIWYDDFY